MSLISVSNLTFSYDTSYDYIFEDVSFQFDTNWKLGFTGRNGRGKTTFLKLLIDEYEYSGHISADIPFRYFPFPVHDSSQNTLDVIDTLGTAYEFWELCRELNLLQVPEEVLFRPFNTLSFGEQTKVMLAALFAESDAFMLLDEPTNHLDTHGKQLVSDYLKSKQGFLLVSHDRSLLDAVTDHTLSINRTNIEIQKGNFSQWYANKMQQDQRETEENRLLKKDISKLKAAARRTTEWSDKVEATKIGCGVFDRGAVGHKAAKMMKRAKSLENRQNTAIKQKESLMKNIEAQETLKLFPLEYHSQTVASCADLEIQYNGYPVVDHFDLTITQGDRIALSGKNGCGKSSIIKLLAGEPVPHTGTAVLSSGVVLSYLPQHASHLAGSLQVFAEEAGIDYTQFLSILRKLGFERVQFEKDLAELSEGQKKKVLLAKSLCEQAHLYIWDEPFNYVDIQSRMQIEELLLAHQPTMLFVEHDAVFTKKIATREITLPKLY